MKGILELAGGGPTAFGDLAPQVLSFGPDVCAEAVFVSEASANKVLAGDVRIRWTVTAMENWDLHHTFNWCAAVGAYSSRKTAHRLYTLLRPPVGTMEAPWAKVLEFSAGILSDMPAGDSQVHRRLLEGIVSSMWTGFATRFFDARARYVYHLSIGHTLMAEDGRQQMLELTVLLGKIGSTAETFKMQCSDNADLHAVLAASQGFAFHPLYMRHATPGSKLPRTAIYKPTGSSQPGCWQHEFNFHQVPQHQSLMYDASAQKVTGTLENCQAVGHFWGDALSAYLPAVFPGPPAQDLANTYLVSATVVGVQ